MKIPSFLRPAARAAAAPVAALALATSAALLLPAATGSAQPILLTNPEGTADGEFGASIVFAGPYVCVGAPSAVVDGLACGAVFVFDANTGAYLAKLAPQGRGPNVIDKVDTGDRFGAALALQGGRLFIGSPGAVASRGRVFYADIPTAGVAATSAFFTAADEESNARFGESLGTDPLNLPAVAIGAPGAAAGKLYLVDASAPAPAAPEPLITAPADTFLGEAVGVYGGMGFAGAPNYASQAGGVFIFGTDSVLQPPGLAPFSQFGAALSVSTAYLAVGAPDEDNATVSTNVGAVYLYDLAANDPMAVPLRFQPASLGNSGRLGTSVAVSGPLVFAGAPYATGADFETGAFVLIDPTVPPYDPLPVAPAGLAFQDHFGDAIAAAPIPGTASTYVAVGAPFADANGVNDAGLVALYRVDPIVVSPKPKKVSTAANTVALKGSVTGGLGGITRVEYSLKAKINYKPLKLVGGRTWRGPAKLKATSTRIYVRAVDASGRTSAPVTIPVTRR